MCEKGTKCAAPSAGSSLCPSSHRRSTLGWSCCRAPEILHCLWPKPNDMPLPPVCFAFEALVQTVFEALFTASFCSQVLQTFDQAVIFHNGQGHPSLPLGLSCHTCKPEGPDIAGNLGILGSLCVLPNLQMHKALVLGASPPMGLVLPPSLPVVPPCLQFEGQ